MIFCYINVVNAGIKQFTWDIHVPLGVPGLRLDFENLLKRASPGFGGGGGQEFFFRFGNLHVAKRRHAAYGEAMRFARGPFGGMPPQRIFFEMVQKHTLVDAFYHILHKK